MKDFSFFVEKRDVKKQSPDINIAKATAKDSIERLELAKSIINSQKPKYVLENAYESIRELIDAILFLDGYKSYSHEASVTYLIKLGFSISDVMKVDLLRRKRNGIKYYGEEANKKEAEESLKIASEFVQKLLNKREELKK